MKTMSANQTHRFFHILLVAMLALAGWPPISRSLLGAQTAAPASSHYETRKEHDPDGTGKFYMGREIAQVMGPGGISWLDRTSREEEEKPALVIDALELHGSETVADIGAGSGFYTFKIAPRLRSGKVLAVDIQDEMIAALRERIRDQKITNVEVIKGSERDPHLPANSVDVALMVDVYHELAFPYEEMMAIRNALKPGGRMVFVEFRKEDPALAIKGLHKMSVDQLKKEMNAVNLTFVKTVETMPIQHIVIFTRPD